MQTRVTRVTNKQIEDKAVHEVIEYEKSQSRKARDVRKDNKGYDVESSGRCIEVKGVGGIFGKKQGSWFFIQPNSVQELLKNDNFWIYVVDNVAPFPYADLGNISIYTIDRDKALRYLKIKPQITYTVAFPKKDLPGLKSK